MGRISSFIMRLTSVLLILVLFSTCIVTGRLAKYVTTASGSDSARVAKFELTETGVQDGVFAVPIAPGEVDVHIVTVQNSSEVAMRYSVQLVNESNNLPGLKFLMTGVDAGGISTGTFHEAAVTFSDDLLPSSEQVTIKIQTSWSDTDPKNAEKIDWVRIVVTAEQID